MSLAARCTHCHTVFRITGAQLAAAQGWVRCGGCSQVFDAASNLVTPSGQALEVPTVTTPELTPVPAAAPVAPEPSPPAAAYQAMPDIDLELPDLGALKAEANAPSAPGPGEGGAPPHSAAGSAPPHSAASAVPAPAVLEGPTPAAPTALHEPSASLAPTPLTASEPEPAPSSGDQREPFWVDAASAERIPPHFDTTADLRGPMAQDTGANRPEQPGVAGAAAVSKSSRLPGMVLVLLTLSLAMLVTYAARGHIAQSWPEARPWLLQACAALGCQLPAIRQLEAVKVQGTSLSRDDTSGHHRLRIQLFNADAAPVLMPAFDLTLVDAQGEVLARRMIDPIELQPAMTQLEPGAEVALSITLDLKALDSASVASFRIAAYYP